MSVFSCNKHILVVKRLLVCLGKNEYINLSFTGDVLVSSVKEAFAELVNTTVVIGKLTALLALKRVFYNLS